MSPIRIQRSRQHKQVSPNGLKIKYVGRPGKWGNPFPVGKRLTLWGRAFIVLEKNKTLKGARDVLKTDVLEQPVTIENSLKWYNIWLTQHIKSGCLGLEELRASTCHVGALSVSHATQTYY